MADREFELRGLIEGGRNAQGEPISKLGYFCAPFRPETGPFSDKVIKVYRSQATPRQLDRLAAAHEAYVDLLTETGIPLPETEFFLLETGGVRVPVIVQQALPEASMMRGLMLRGSRDEALRLMEAAGEVIATFWAAVDGNSQRIGFHPSIRNLAVIDGRGIFFDTFPPLIGYSRQEMGELLVLFSGSPLMRTVGRVARSKVTSVQDEWYSPPETLVGLVGSACRLRPDDTDAFLDWGRDFAGRRMGRHAAEALAGLQAVPRLPGYWVAFRRMLGLQGEPNL